MLTTQKSNVADETRIRELSEYLAQAIRTEDIEGITSHYAPDFLLFDLHSTDLKP